MSDQTPFTQPLLRAVLSSASAALAAHLRRFPRDVDTPNLFFTLLGPWIVDRSNLSLDQVQRLKQSEAQILETGFPSTELVVELAALLDLDGFLKQCCGTPIALSFHINREFIPSLLPLLTEQVDSEKFDELYRRFEKVTYGQGPFRRVSYTHVFNLSTQVDNLSIFPGAVLRTVSTTDIPLLLNEATLGDSFLHPSGSGNVFFSTEQEAESAENDGIWLTNQRNLAMELCTVLQYVADGIVNLGYTGIHFNPPWVNSFRKPNTFFQGELRRRPYRNGEDPYLLDARLFDSVIRWLSVLAHPPNRERMALVGHDLRTTIERAGTYYESSHERTDPLERLVALAIALEALFSPSDSGELRYRISQNAAILLGRNFEERKRIFSSTKSMYDLRSKIVHGSYDMSKYKSGELVTEQSLREWGSYLRRCVLAYVILLLRGYERRGQILDKLSDACFDDALGAELRSDSDAGTFVNEFFASKSM